MARGRSKDREGSSPVEKPVRYQSWPAFSPFSMMRRFADQMDRIFEGFSPQIDSVERDGKLIIRADLPGMTKDDVKVEITGQAVVIDGERKYDRSYGRFHREIPLPEGARTDKAAATFKNGVLEVTVEAPAGSTNRRQIEIHGEDAA